MTMLETLRAAKDFIAGAAPWLPRDSRYGIDSLDADELTAALATRVPGAHVQRLTTERTAQGAADAARVRLEWNQAGVDAGLPPSVFVKGTPSHVGSRIVLSAMHCHTNEANFYVRVAPTLADLTPTAYVTRAGTGARHTIAIEDLTLNPGTVLFELGADAPKAHAEGVIDTLACLHGRFWESPRFSTDLAWMPPPDRSVAPIVRQSYAWGAKRFLQSDRDIPTAVRRLTQVYVDHHDELAEVWRSLPSTVVHTDCHLGNTYALADGRVGLYDWQAVQRTNGLVDVAAFMMTSISTERRRAEEERVLERYLDRLAAEGAGNRAPSFAEAWDLYRLLTLEPWMSCLMTIVIGGMIPEDVMEVVAARAMSVLTDLDVESVVAKHLARR
jgi:aminoglycoside/choline kinase family phosphotransferase